jgi:drug/metabolite transporter (DMT)-like permease
MIRSLPPAAVPLVRAVAGAALISFSGVWVKLANVGPATSAFYRVAIGGAVLVAAALFLRLRLWNGTRHLLLAGGCALAFALDLWAYHQSVLFIGPGLGTILPNFQVFVLAGAGVLFFGEPLRGRFLVAVPLAVVGLLMVVGVDWSSLPDTYRQGVVYGLCAAVFYAAFTLTLRRLQAVRPPLEPAANLALVCIVTSLLLGVEMAAVGESFAVPDARSWAALLALGVCSQVVGWVLITRSLPVVPASLVGLLLLLQPSLAFLWDMLLFRRPTTAANAAGVALTLGAIYLGLSGRARRK